MQILLGFKAKIVKAQQRVSLHGLEPLAVEIGKVLNVIQRGGISRSSMANSSPDSSPTLLPFNTMIHMVTIKLSSSNYLLWKSQLLPHLESQGLLGHVDGTLVPPPLFDPPTSQTPNNKHLAWKATNQCLLILLLLSLTEEAMAEAVGLSTSREVWTALENTFSHRFKARELRLKDDLQLMKCGTRSVTAFAQTPASSTAAFTATRNSSHRGGGSRPHHGRRNVQRNNSSHGQGHANATYGRRQPRCQICRQERHFADWCRQRGFNLYDSSPLYLGSVFHLHG
ncbi:hypothetical protein F3Y22_tig00110890pilonHSYRG01507 [Hibiscus syriacus]|uniref:Retrotransposon Copia-like N-terminal domain-containing protein n=1 Tax=Hibiscus syriacus TaxID=106335 RepID=A0A6A2ZIR5_HIBSY|nr:hypothetical protein F3Y22_tig00110890pilonHSYRG01507 [Hibiscus syriacus]